MNASWVMNFLYRDSKKVFNKTTYPVSKYNLLQGGAIF